MRDVIQRLEARGEAILARELENAYASIDCQKAPKFLKQLKNKGEVHFKKLVNIVTRFFGKPRQRGTSHKVFKTPWGDLLTLQNDKGKAKRYQVKQVREALEKLLMKKCDIDLGPAKASASTERADFRTYPYEDGYICVCASMPSLSWVASSERKALAGAIRVYHTMQ